VCKLKHFQIVLTKDSHGEESKSSEDEEEKPETLQVKVLQISLKSKEGLTSNQSFKIKWRLGGIKVLVLVNWGASTNFITKKLNHLKLEGNETTKFEVEIRTRDKVIEG